MLWQVLLIICLILCVCFGWVLLYGAPYLPTLKKQVKTAIELADLRAGDTIIELGCGDGRVLMEAAKRGYKSIGYELNPLLFVIAWIRTKKYRYMTQVIYGNFWKKTWPQADAIYVFLLPRLMAKLDQKISSEKVAKGRVISFAFKFPDRSPLAEKDGVYMYDLNDPIV